MNKQNLWFMTLFSLILVLSVYYVTMPNDLLLTNVPKKDDDPVSVTVDNEEIIVALKINKEAENLALQSDYQSIITDTKSTTEEKNEALEKMNQLKERMTTESVLEEKLNNNYKLACCVNLENVVVSVTCSSSNHNETLANSIMRSVQEEFTSNKAITVKFET